MHQVAIPSLHAGVRKCTQNTPEANSVPDRDAGTLPCASAKFRARTTPHFLLAVQLQAQRIADCDKIQLRDVQSFATPLSCGRVVRSTPSRVLHR